MPQVSRHTLRRRLLLQIGLMIGALLALGIMAVVQINRLHEDFGVAIQGYQQLRQLYEIGFPLAQAREMLGETEWDTGKVVLALQAALVRSGQFAGGGQLGQQLRQIKVQAEGLTAGDLAGRQQVLFALNGQMAQLAQLSANISQTIESRQ